MEDLKLLFYFWDASAPPDRDVEQWEVSICEFEGGHANGRVGMGVEDKFGHRQVVQPVILSVVAV